MNVKFLVLSAVLLVFFAAAVCAQNETVGNDAKAFSSGLGAKVRLLQLESALERNILEGNLIVDSVKAANSSADTSDLEAVLAQMSQLRDEVNSTVPGFGDEAARNFTDMKGDAIALTKEFRQKALALVKSEDIPGLRAKIRQIDSDTLKGLRGRINETRIEYNAQKVREILDSLGLQNPGLVDDVRSGNATLKDVRDYIRDATQNMSKTDRRQAFQKLMEANAKGGVFLRSVSDKFKVNQLERVQKRVDRRLNATLSENVSDDVRQRLENRSEWVQERLDAVSGRLDKDIARIGSLTEKKQSQIDKVIGKLENLSDKRTGKLQELLDSGNLTDEERQSVEDRLAKWGNHTDKLTDRLLEKKNKTEERGQNLQDRLNGSGHGKNGGGGQ